MRPFLISALLLSLVSGCSTVKLGPHRIDVQQGNALDQENVARLKTGLNRSQVRFLLGTPLVVDPFRTDRWDYVYVNYKAGRLAEQKRITLFFDGETLVRIEGDVPAAESVAPASSAPATTDPKANARMEPEASAAVEAHALPRQVAPQAEPIPLAQASSSPAPAQPRQPAKQQSAPAPTPAAIAQQDAEPAPATEARPRSQPAAPAPERVVPAPSAAVAESRPAGVETSVVKPLPSPKHVPAYRDPRAPAELSLLAETNVEQLRPDVMPPFPQAGQAMAPTDKGPRNDEEVLSALRGWAQAWSNRDEDAYVTAYDAEFVPQGNETRAEWEKRRRLLLRVARNIDLRIDSPSVRYLADGSAIVTFNQYYRSDKFSDAVVKQMRMVKREEQWQIVEEKVVSVVRGAQQ